MLNVNTYIKKSGDACSRFLDAVKSKNKLFYKQLDCRICNELSEFVEYLIQYIKE